MRDNFDIFDFELSAEDMAEIAKLNKGKRYYTVTLAEQEHFTQWKPED